jgi:YidC/Oxa1 family membrane protein insertase
MEKNTVIAVALAVVVIIGSMFVQAKFFPPPELPQRTPAAEAPAAAPPAAVQPAQPAQAVPAANVAPGPDLQPLEGLLEEESITMETDVFDITFSNRGAVVTSVRLKEYSNTDGSPVEMVLSQESGRYPFALQLGSRNAPGAQGAAAGSELYYYEKSPGGQRLDFYRDFYSWTGVPFRLTKSFVFKPDDYMMELRVTVENSVNDVPALGDAGIAYTLTAGPQIGPEYKKLDRRNEYRMYIIYANGKKKNVKAGKNDVTVLEERVNWASVCGKYFALIAMTDATDYRISYDTRTLSGLQDQSSLLFERPELKSAKQVDSYRFFLGPKDPKILARYNDAGKNAYGLEDRHFEETATSSLIIRPLAKLLMLIMELFYKVIPNYGIAILFTTLLIKIVLFPLTHKSFESTSRMQALQPKMAELREKYKSNPQKMNQEVAALYKREGVNPLGGCLPLLLQMPIFFAMYNLLSTHFDLRGAVFIQGWIMDLSAPESIWDFSSLLPGGLPFVGWQNLRLLPIIMVATTFLQSRLTQAPDASNKNMKMMSYMMPIMFFFILYEMPSGLVLYWTVQNILTVFQQMYTNRRRKLKNGAVAVGPEGGGKKRAGGR